MTSSETVAEIPLVLQGTGYKVYWYNYWDISFGFSPNKDVILDDTWGDYEDYTTGLTYDKRLSWRDDASGGRAVCSVEYVYVYICVTISCKHKTLTGALRTITKWWIYMVQGNILSIMYPIGTQSSQ